jgi:hypothetical protein
MRLGAVGIHRAAPFGGHNELPSQRALAGGPHAAVGAAREPEKWIRRRMPKLMYHDLFAVAARAFSVWPDQSLLGGTATIGNHKIIAGRIAKAVPTIDSSACNGVSQAVRRPEGEQEFVHLQSASRIWG